MKIERLDLIAYGAFTDVSLDLSAGPRQLHLIYGPNESGKSTTLRAIAGLLYGIDHSNRDDYVHDYRLQRIGGLLTYDDEALDCVRRKGTRNTLLDRDGAPTDESRLAAMLRGIDAETFRQQYGLTHDALVAGGNAILKGDGDLGEILFSAGAGLGQLKRIRATIVDQAAALFKPRGSRPTINRLTKQLDQLRRDLREKQLRPAEYQQQVEALEADEQAAAERDQAVAQQQQQLDVLGRLRQSLPMLQQRGELLEALQPLANVTLLDADFVQRRRAADEERRQQQLHVENLRSQLTRTENQLRELPADELDEVQITQIRNLYERVQPVRHAREQIEVLIHQRQTLRDQIAEMMRRIDRDREPEQWEQLRLSTAQRAQVDDLFDQLSRVQAQYDQAKTNLNRVEQDCRRAEQELEQTSEPSDPIALEECLQQIGSPATLQENLAEAARQAERKRKRCQRQAAKLVGFAGDFQAAAGLKLPAPSKLESARQLWQQTHRDCETAETEMQRLAAELAEAEQRREQLNAETTVATEAELAEARGQRDQLLTELSQDSTVDRLVRLTQSIQHADQMVDQMRRESKRVATRAELESRCRQLSDEQRRAHEKRAQAEAAAQQAREDWYRLWQAAGIEALEPDGMTRWHAEHEKLQTLIEELEHAESNHDRAQQQLANALKRLRDADADLPETEALPELHRAAKVQLRQRREAFQDYRDRREALQQLQRQLPEARETFEAQDQALRQWEHDWHQCTQALGDREQVPPHSMMRIVKEIDQLETKQGELRGCDANLKRYQTASQGFEQDVTKLTQAIGEPYTQLPDLDAVETLHNKLQQQTAHTENRQRLLKQQQELDGQREQAEQAVRTAREKLQQLAHEAGCAELEELPQYESRSDQRRDLQRRLDAVDDKLRLLAGGESTAAWIERARDRNHEELTEAIQRAESELKQQMEAQTQLREQVVTRRNRVRELDTGGEAAALNQQIQSVVAELRRQALQFARLRCADVILQQTIDIYRNSHESDVLNQAAEYFRQLTCEDYSGLEVTFDDQSDRPCLVAIRDSKPVPVTALSDGAADTLYLALRLASLRRDLLQRGPFPLIVDDLLIQLDDRRAAAALAALSDLSEQTQVIFFTHHQHLIDLAREVLPADGFHAQELPAAAWLGVHS